MPVSNVFVLGVPVPSLARLGLTPDADLIFRTLATLGPRTAGGLATELGLSRRRVEQSLAELFETRCVTRDGPPQSPTWQAEAADRVVNTLRRSSHRRASLRSVRVEPGPVELSSEMQHLPSRALTRVRLAELFSGARHETLTLHTEAAFDAPAMRGATAMDRLLLARRVNIRIIGVQPPDPGRLEPYGGQNTQQRVSYRELVEVPMKLFVIDRQVALFPVDPRDHDRGYIEIIQTPVVQSLVETFERCWTAANVPEEIKMPQPFIAPREEVLITLLVYGHTDASAAREMQISERSVSNMMRALMDRFGVENRFQLGVALGSLRAAPNPPGLKALEE